MSKLKPCPFCGGQAVTKTFSDADIDFQVSCKNERCIKGWYLSPEEWNTRAIEDKLNIRIAQLEEEVIYFKKWSEYFKGRLGISGKRSVRDERE